MRVGEDDAYWMAGSSSNPGTVFFIMMLVVGVLLLFLQDDSKLYQTCMDGPHTTQNVILEDGTSHTACIPQEGSDVIIERPL